MSRWREVNVCTECGFVDDTAAAGKAWFRVCPDCGTSANRITGMWPDLWVVKVARRVGRFSKRWEIKE